MSLLTLNGLPVLSAEIRMPRVGVCNADLSIDSADDVSGAVTLETDDGSFSLVGRATRDLAFLEHLRMRFVGGIGDLDQPLAPKAYNGFTVRSILKDILAETVSHLSPDTDTALLNTFLTKWVRLGADRAKDALQAILGYAGAASWRVLPDGTVWATKAEPWTSATESDYQVTTRSSAEGWILIECERPFVLPGQVITLPDEAVGSGSPDQRISAVTHIIESGVVQSRLYVEDAT